MAAAYGEIFIFDWQSIKTVARLLQWVIYSAAHITLNKHNVHVTFKTAEKWSSAIGSKKGNIL